MEGFSEEKEARLKKLSKVMFLIAKICRILISIAIVCIALTSVVVPIFWNNVTIGDGSVSIFGQDINYEIGDASIKLGDEILKLNQIENLKEVITGHSTLFYILTSEFAILFSVYVSVLAWLALKDAEKIFDKMKDDAKPFTLDNVELLGKIGKLLLIIIISDIVFGTIMSIVLKTGVNIEFGFSTIVLVLIVFVLKYVFEYGLSLENKKLSGGNKE